jgi:hypothetical protein
LSLASVVAMTLLIAAPSGASAATQIGETFAPSAFCDTSRTRLQSVSPGGQYSAPSDGVITSWSFQAGAAPPDLRFKVGRAAPGADLTMNADFTIVGESGIQTNLTPNTLNSFFTQIPVKTGDVIGFFNATTSAGSCGIGGGGATGYTAHVFAGDPHPGDTQTFTFQATSKWDVSALLEPDCDNDGLGDETQDPDLSSCAPPPPGTPPGPGIPPPGSPPGTPPVTCRGLPATIVGTDGNDVRTGSLGQDVIAGLGGNDTLSGIGGNDVVCGGAGNDGLNGGNGKDTLLGQKGNDKLKGGPGKDKLSGKKGKDTLKGAGGNDKLKGGGGRDVCIGGKANDSASKCEVEKSI